MHTVTAGGLLNISLSNPILDYSNLLALTGYLTQNPLEVEEMFRRMVFNYFTDNKDDHCKNFSFTIQKSDTGTWQWHLAPAYDLTLCTEGYNGEHATSVNGTGHPTIQDMITIGTKSKMNKLCCMRIIEEVRAGCGDLLLFLMANHGSTINPDFNHFFPSILEPFLKDVIRNLVLDTKRLERLSMRQSLGPVLKVKTFKIFTAIHNSMNLIGSEVIPFNQ